MKSVCQNKWCKVSYEHDESYTHKICPKCVSMQNEVSGGVTWQEKKYEGPRWDGLPHHIKMKVNMFK